MLSLDLRIPLLITVLLVPAAGAQAVARPARAAHAAALGLKKSSGPVTVDVSSRR